MSINTNTYILFFLILTIIGCSSQKYNSAINNIAYEVINRTLEIDKEDRIKNYETYDNKSLSQKLIKEVNSETKRVYPFFIKFNSNRARYSTYNYEVDTTFLFSLIDYKSIKYCDDFKVSDLELIENKNHYLKQLFNAPDKIKFKNINKQYKPYHTKLMDETHINSYNTHKKLLTKKQLASMHRNFLREENSSFTISYPVFSKDFKKAIILIDNDFQGGQIWFLKLINGKWERECYISRIKY